MEAFLIGIEESAFSIAISESSWMFPSIESMHVVAVALVFGTIVIMDLKLVGLASRAQTYWALSREVLPWTWAGFVIAALTGALMFVSRAATYAYNPLFLSKMALLVIAGLNMAAFHLLVVRKMEAQGGSADWLPVEAKIAGALSIVLWIGVVFLGRWIGFV